LLFRQIGVVNERPSTKTNGIEIIKAAAAEFLSASSHLAETAICRFAERPISRFSVAVIHELEGLARGSKSPAPLTAPAENAQHVKYVAERSSLALAFLKGRPQGVRYVTSKGTILAPTGVAMEEESGEQVCNFFPVYLSTKLICE